MYRNVVCTLLNIQLLLLIFSWGCVKVVIVIIVLVIFVFSVIIIDIIAIIIVVVFISAVVLGYLKS